MTGTGGGAGHGPGARARTLLERCVRMAGADGAGLTLARHGGAEPVLGTDAVAEALEFAQFTLGEGPGVDAAAFGYPVSVPDLTQLGRAHAGRWPAFTPEALTLGVRSVVALPLRVGTTSIGAADLYRRRPGYLRGEAFAQALLALDAVVLACVSPDEAAEVEEEPVPLRSLEVHRAAGMVMMQLGGDIQEALARLRAAAYAEGLPLEELARQVVTRRRRLEDDGSRE